MRRATGYAIACAVTGGLGLATMIYRGPAHAFLRGTGADALVVACLYCMLGIRWPERRALRAAAVAAIALVIELHQLTPIAAAPRTLATEVTLGSTFDSWDLVAYAVGLALAVVIERALRGQAAARGRAFEAT